jgi:hypothetical protein
VSWCRSGGRQSSGGKLHLDRAATDGDHIRVELRIPQVGISPVQVGLAVVVDIYRRIDLVVRDQRLANSILVRTKDIVTDCHTDRHGTALLLDRYVVVEFAVARNNLTGPGSRACPAEGSQTHYNAMVLPVSHVSR